MLTQVDEESLIKYGGRVRAEYLVQQAGYTLGVARMDGQPLWDLLIPGYEGATEEAMKAIETRRHEKTFAAEESRLATVNQNEWVAEAKVFRRRAAGSALLATRLGKPMPDKLLRIGRAPTLQALLGQVVDMVDLLEMHAAEIPGQVRQLIDQGRTIVHKLSSADMEQEVKRLAELPQAVRAYHADKGRLYLAIKAINDAGRQLHAANAHMASRYSLAILHRPGPKRASAKVAAESMGAPVHESASE